MQGTEILNPGQTCVLGADQTLYAIIKLMQWQFPDTLGEDKLVVIVGALHIEDKMHLMIGKLQRDTGWATILSQAEVLTSGRAESTLDEHHIKHTRYAHQVSLVSLYKETSDYMYNHATNSAASSTPWTIRSSLHNKDQSHEQSNKILQTNGGAAGLNEIHEALMLFLLAGPVGGAQLASDVLKGYIIFREGSRTAWQPFRCNKSGAGSTRYSECIGGVRCGISISASWISLSPAAPPFVWRILFDCSCAWSLAIRLSCLRDFCTTKFPFMNSACTSGLCCASWTVWSRALN